ncbi:MULTISPECIES: 16S rRNA (cytosine(1402)-N(4))-methyltransferase RsmH [Actinoalloteichus]|uniref:Ribosomal RNA small subunit methyltransferase H n=1 Tax=Actinoalloteichus fjordicus TaxID=1612552 RepID=A0AAC9PR71_9PSEU|nr:MULTISPECIES: 16S rRNA (cytosine(1402)-N(4))-methyltransferase RsmH [Actinoalloteichus]APU13984.1 16S rRNA (cytosine(1402)-N(4))-methyltransferase [Actinoalloteichus fjordicus]APU19930.1 16S rRNA (cytosine(1402)-N(4))-methyltransferase [Actinoalloteichus sp. GBA129-24]
MTEKNTPSRADGRARHVPVLLDRTLELLGPALSGDQPVLVDATLGLGGHTEAFLTAYPSLTVVGLDRDPHALRLAGERLAGFGDRARLVQAVYDELPEALAGLGIPRVDGVLFDLGVSSMQLDETERGFAYAQDSPLDMRMNPETGPTAADVLNEYATRDLARVLRVYGEERFASRIAAAVVRERAKAPFVTSGRLVELIYDSVPAATRRTGGHPAKRTFQALRIEVNTELDVLGRAVPAAVDALRTGGRVVVLSYHSLEDRIVKQALVGRSRSTSPEGLPVELPGHGPELRLLVRRGEQASEDEVAANPRAASVRLRAAERIKEASG